VKSFFKYFLAALLALVVFCGIILVIMIGLVGSLMDTEKPFVPARSVLVVDLSRNFSETKVMNPLVEFTGNTEDEVPTLYELLQMIKKAETDSSIRGIYVVANGNANGFAASEEIRNALISFKKKGKFIFSYGDYITQKAYGVANVADKIYCNPKGMLDWRGFSVDYMYFKNLLKNLEIEPQIFYDGKFKSATEPFREEKMTDANRIQTEAWLGDLYAGFLQKTAMVRGVDTATLHGYANQYAIASPKEGVRLKLLDGVRYDDELKLEMKKKLGLAEDDKISFITPGTYAASGILQNKFVKDKIALVFAEGEIVYGKGDEGNIGSDDYRDILRKIRFNKDVKAVVLRINSPGGSSLASEIIWREIELIKKSGKPVIVSMGDVAASGGYYIACNADSILAQPNTITGSIGVFAIVPNMQGFMKNKLGITFDGVKTAKYADALTVTRPMNTDEKRIIQHEVDNIYMDFKTRVADGRKRDTAYIDSIAQGRVWTGTRALQIGLVDRLASLDDAIKSAAALAKLKEYGIRQYPEEKSPFEVIFGSYGKNYKAEILQSEMGEDQYRLFMEIKKMKAQTGEIQAKMPFVFEVN
jgi:protease IV